ncbi:MULTISPECIES: [FeFe] hydrogenase H-cluster maturation GTPase HydF [Carboxydocella]|uniref:Iron-only hydrogenase maturation protein HydF n=2 Tax=Carboxydocella TaxID=178898 RepID=A0A1T4S3U1_9FIRM|nr:MULTISPECIES: [FeFe] hydrogenase H-cluster maturation GTPase HydF [Carboxydocella]AVX21209.1 iron-only hydrogenase maturation protein HydF [Carboxydocella thermautotrophica]AVX31643.1 iron-only hydrogenase maturation protein HydF [Carboxydocella thermautotrophica]GAW30237.1 iron-only hydrogenase maturation protein HydF [Carboxydocella sp. JDF658]SKA22895.1 iron-only hydrogenase maturation protein HydF [Carboxydocella sporoproducens DSM 16521]
MLETPRANRLHIALFGRRNAGKSSLINALTNQDIALVSPIPGTTTDPVYKAMEILPLGPVVLIDTAGLDDEGELGQLRVQKTREVLPKADLALLVVDATTGITSFDREIAALCRQHNLPLVGVLNKSDLADPDLAAARAVLDLPWVKVSSRTGAGIEELKQAMIEQAPQNWEPETILGDLVKPGDTVVLVVPIDSAAPKGRLILPQVQVLRDCLDHGVMAYVCREFELEQTLANLQQPPALVVTDSQAFGLVSRLVPENVPLTSFSILYARYKGDLATLAAGARAISALKPGDRVLIAEACTHHRQPDDIGRAKIPRWLNQLAGGELQYTWSSGQGYPDNLEDFKLIVHCGACMLNRRSMLHRLQQARSRQVPIVNYGVLIAAVHGILERVLKPFGV